MIVSPQISQLEDKSQWVETAPGIFAPVIDSRSADTVVVTPDGQTVIIGGLMQKSKLQSESKIPILGDIPILGNLFKHKMRSDSKTELIIFLTPHIVMAPSQLAALTAAERTQMEMAPKAFTEQDLNRFLEGLPRQDKNGALSNEKTPNKKGSKSNKFEK
jgi:type II secretory pathway component GspD/PulD (secretin)